MRSCSAEGSGGVSGAGRGSSSGTSYCCVKGGFSVTVGSSVVVVSTKGTDIVCMQVGQTSEVGQGVQGREIGQ